MFVPIVFIVIRRGNFWRIDYNTETDFSEIFGEILFGNIGYSEIGLISALGRNECARACKNIGNDEFFTTLENALFCFCFDEEVPKTRTDPSLQAKYLLRPNWNRWYNSSLQFVSSGDGFTGCIYDHTVSEGIVIIELCESIFRVVNAEKNKNNCETEVRNNEDLNSKIPEIKMPDTKIHQTKIIETNITTPDKNFQKLTLPTSSLRFKPPRTDVKIRVYKYKLYGKDFIKSQRFSPDAYIQVALQLAYYLTHFQFTATYESCSIRKFNLGRVDNIRACQQPSIDFCKSVLKQESASVKVRNSKKQENLQLLMEKAIHNQTKHTQKVVNGKGLDNHLLGLSSVRQVRFVIFCFSVD